MGKGYIKAWALAIVGAGFWASAALAAPITHAKAAAELEAYFNAMTTLEANFTQTQSANSSNQPREVQKGTFKANRPKGQFVWQYVTPIRQKVVGTGTAVYYIDQSARAGDGQVTQLPIDAGMGRLLRGGLLSLRAMQLEVAGVREHNGVRHIALTPSAGAGSAANQGLKQLEVMLATPKGAKPTLVAFSATDALGVTMRISLSEVRAGGVIPAKTFAYTPPQQRIR
jgi:outer membrane lipoprotein-sorting protein